MKKVVPNLGYQTFLPEVAKGQTREWGSLIPPGFLQFTAQPAPPFDSTFKPTEWTMIAIHVCEGICVFNDLFGVGMSAPGLFKSGIFVAL
ncbi:hypothetical protein RSAG8_10522, partial [Rhizoctonia solani AG-8 WAC10335]